MKISYEWLKDFIDCDISPDRLAAGLTECGLEVSSIESKTVPAGVIVSKICAITDHPNAEKLSICTLDIGTSTPFSVVCGAPNIRVGMLAPLAREGVVLNNNFVVKKAKIRGIESAGMLCSERELGVSDDHSGIMQLPANLAVGKELREIIPDNTVFEIEITPNRGDCLSVLGVSREIAAKFGLKLKPHGKIPIEDKNYSISDGISVTIEEPLLCRRYLGRLIKGVTIAESPLWLKQRLRDASIRPINNIVDVTNYIMMHYGQPMHAFDYASIEGKKIIVRKAGSTGSFVTLDGVERKLHPDDLLIWDANRAVALAGIMGGAGSEISSKTTDVFLECAFFDPVCIRKTSKRLGLSTDSSYRFERGVDPAEGLEAAINTAAQMICELASGSCARGLIDIRGEPLPKKIISLRPKRVNSLLGTEITSEKIVSLLAALNFNLVSNESEVFSFGVPSFRHDISIEADLIEEIARMYGYNNIPPAEIATVNMFRRRPIEEHTWEKIRRCLAYSGFNEIVTNSFSSERHRQLLTPQIKAVELRNPLNPQMSQMRTTMLGSILQIVAYNLNRKNRNNRFFEIGKIFNSRTNDDLPLENDILAIVAEGDFWPSTWNSAARQCDFYIFKGILERFSLNARLGPLTFRNDRTNHPWFEYDYAYIESPLACGIVGRVREEICREFDVKSTVVYYAELDITNLLRKNPPSVKYKPLPKYPAVERDLCFVMDDTINAEVIVKEIVGTSPLVEAVYPFDLFRGKSLGAGKKSITFSLRLRSAERTLTDKEADDICSKIIRTMEVKHNIVLRKA